MSVYFTIKEHLSVKNIESECVCMPLEAMRVHIANLGAMMLFDRASIYSIKLSADDKEYAFSGKEVTPELHALIRAMMDANETVELVAEYGYSLTLGLDYLQPGFYVSEVVEEELKERPEEAGNLFYSMYHEEDGCVGTGDLVAYGTKDGKQYNGKIEPTEADLPDRGNWIAADPPVCFCADAEELEEMDVDAIKEACRAFCVLDKDILWEDKVDNVSIGERKCRYPNITFCRDEEGIEFYVNNVTLETKADFERYIALCSNLIRATEGQCSMLTQFVDFSLDDARTIDLDFDVDGNCTVKMASV